ncbi:VTT domain-containing protein [Methanolobus zinderi]|uniref:VTT domain-containing protein n=1 Tax=Methanolobus zinderi TaxID=536044 RepID=UPI001FE6B0B3|nr:VTT domain-containing protein [Methanolobus zinderi]
MPSANMTGDTDYTDDHVNSCKLVNNTGSSKRKDLLVAISLVLFIIAWSVLLVYYPPEKVVEFLGVQNTYLIVFLLAASGGVSAFTSTSFYTALVTISLGGVNPVYLAIFASVGLTLGDIVFYVVGKKGRSCVTPTYGKYINRFLQLVEKVSDRTIILLIFFYSLTPLPSDILAIVLAILGFPLKKMVPPLLAGNFALTLILAELAIYGYQFF